MKITLIRHTRVAVETGICYGWSDVGVAPSFETEASRVKENISNEQFDIVYSSPLSRGHTDACIFTHRGVIACAMVYAGICPIEESFSIEVDYGSKNVLEF